MLQSSPIIVIGMHRSGTRALAQILERLGIFMGADQQADSESITFMSINEGILHQCGGFWSEPMSAHFLLSQPEFVDTLAASVRATLAARLGDYVGRSGLLSGAGGAALPAFGWKDPRNTFTLPVWRRVFPNARVIHIVRHGVDVAASLARRHSAALRAAAGTSVPAALTVIEDHGLGVLSSRRGWTLPEALTMWEQYVEKARLETAELGDALEVRFEDLLADPWPVISSIAQWCGANLSDKDPKWIENLRADRAFAYRQDPALVEFATTAREVLVRYGYSP
ncbi:MAG TPA: sulfotransferase [Gammaproteobacteria bacterium]|nr:sulfotransferase [Gammaproteobacteria bacterium]